MISLIDVKRASLPELLAFAAANGHPIPEDKQDDRGHVVVVVCLVMLYSEPQERRGVEL